MSLTKQSSGTPDTANHKAASQAEPIVVASKLGYRVDIAGRPMTILDEVSLSISPAEVVAVVGPSGSGKTSTLMLLAGLEKASSGQIIVGGTDITQLDEGQLAQFRRNTLGIVFQSFHLIPSLSALDNVGLALEIASPNLPLAEVRARAGEALEAVGLGHRLDHRPPALSGGEQQRVSLARALVTRPKLLLADEPTGNLDQKTGAMVIELMFDLARRNNTAVLLITHDPHLAERADRVLTMTGGQLSQSPAGAR